MFVCVCLRARVYVCVRFVTTDGFPSFLAFCGFCVFFSVFLCSSDDTERMMDDDPRIVLKPLRTAEDA